jgi:hypothetical protein
MTIHATVPVSLSADRTGRGVRAAGQRPVGRVYHVGAVGGVPRGVRVPAESVLIRIKLSCKLSLIGNPLP